MVPVRLMSYPPVQALTITPTINTREAPITENQGKEIWKTENSGSSLGTECELIHDVLETERRETQVKHSH